ncbi:UbiA-like protein EboC [Sphingobacterium sp. HJSM2_6]|uniref:UbiA-like protein EboC n=1 Tax=Sphingobacterium sp. HJSM2_6 TaxID=3366264 RepID=UPI003BD0D80A
MKAWLQLIRPANVLTAISDVMAGVALAGLFLQINLPDTYTLVLIAVSSMLLYTGGIVFNDVFDAKLDQIERPERPIPAGRVPKFAAVILGTMAFTAGCLIVGSLNDYALGIAILIVMMCLVYNGKAKHHFILGPICMGACRGLNLLLGMAVFPESLQYWYVAIVPVIYIAAVTNISRGEVYGNNKTAMLVSVGLYSLVLLTMLSFTIHFGHYSAFAFLLAFILLIGTPLKKALKSLAPPDIRKSVKFGVLALILMNASWIAIAGFPYLALAVCVILPVSIYLAKKFAVT